MDDIDEQIDEYIEKGIQWLEQPFPEDAPHDAKGYIGIVTQARFVLASFDIEHQGFPPGSRGYDGTCTIGSSIIHLTREQAQRLCKDAEASLSETKT